VLIKLRVSPEATASPSLIQLIFGTGFPTALQWNVTLAASRTVWSLGLVIKLGETTTNSTGKLIKKRFCSLHLSITCGL